MFSRVTSDIERPAGDSAAALNSLSYLSNEHLPAADSVRVALLLVGELRSFPFTSPWLQAHIISSIGTDFVDVFAAVRPLPASPSGTACGHVRSHLSNVVSCHEVPTITGVLCTVFPPFSLFPFPPSNTLQATATRPGKSLRTPWASWAAPRSTIAGRGAGGRRRKRARSVLRRGFISFRSWGLLLMSCSVLSSPRRCDTVT